MNRKILSLVLFWVFMGTEGPTEAYDIPAKKPLEYFSSVMDSLPRDDCGWLKWVVVNTQPGTIAHFETSTDDERLQFIEEFDPDMFDWWSGLLMNRAYIATMRGIAADSTIEYEYEAPLHGVKGFAKEIYGHNGPGVREDGSAPIDNYGDRQMTHLAPKWHKTLLSAHTRLSLYGDMVCQDNLIHGLHYNYGQFDNWSNRRFVAYMTERFSREYLHRIGFNTDKFHICLYLRHKRKTLANHQLLEDPIIHEFIRFYYIASIASVVDLNRAIKQVPRHLTGATTAFYGNLGSMTRLRTPGIAYSPYVDMVWVEDLSAYQPCFDKTVQAKSSLMYKIGRSAGNYNKPVCFYLSPPQVAKKRMGSAVTAAEAYANGGLVVLASHYKKNGGKSGPYYKSHLHHAKFVNKYRHLFIDRQAVADTAVVNSVPSLFWRWFSSLEVKRPHLDHLAAVGRLLEDKHIPYETLLFGHPDIYDDSAQLKRLSKYKTIVLPNVDCLSDRQGKALCQWVKRGGRLILWGEVATRDEELRRRKGNPFQQIIAGPGKGRVLTTHRTGPSVASARTRDIVVDYIERKDGADEKLSRLFSRKDPLIETDLPSTTWLNVWQHGAGPMLSVQMVNYDIDMKNDTVKPVKDFVIKIRVPAGTRYSSAWYCCTDHSADDVSRLPKPVRLPFKSKGGYVEVRIPHLGLFGVLSLATKSEYEARETAAQVRKWYERLKISHRTPRCHKGDSGSLLRKAKEYLALIQGDAGVDRFGPFMEPGQDLAEELRAAVERITEEATEQQRHASMAASLGKRAVHRFDFGTKEHPQGWIPVGIDSDYSKEKGFGWSRKNTLDAVSQIPVICSKRNEPLSGLEKMHGDYVRSMDPVKYMKRTSNNKFYPVVLPPANEAHFQVDLPNGEYVVTALMGDYDAYYNAHRVGVTYIDAEGLPASYGERLYSGCYRSTVFPVTVKDGSLDLRFWGRNVGPLYQNNCEWLINGLVIQKANQLSPSAAKQLSARNLFSASVIRDWHVLGPFDDPEWYGLEKVHGPGKGVDLHAAYKNQNGLLKWHKLETLKGTAPCISFNHMQENAKGKGAASFAFTTVYSEKERDAYLLASLSQFGTVYLNGRAVIEDRLPAGLLQSEHRVKIKLAEGANTVLIKSCNFWGDEWSAWLAITDSGPCGVEHDSE